MTPDEQTQRELAECQRAAAEQRRVMEATIEAANLHIQQLLDEIEAREDACRK